MRSPILVSIAVVLCLVNFSYAAVSFAVANDAHGNPHVYIKGFDKAAKGGGCRIHVEYARALIQLDTDGKLALMNASNKVEASSLEQANTNGTPAATAPTDADDLCLIEVTLKDQGRRLNLML